eukprot:symbB.v1.2.013557.t4/scaffold952.1/size217748/15
MSPITQSAGTGLGIVGDGKGWSGGSTRPDGEANQPQSIKEKRPKIFLEVELHKRQLGRVVLELFGDVVPKTVENFRCLCTGERGISAVSGKPLSFKGSRFHKIIPGKTIQGGDITKGDGSGGDSIYNQDGDGTFASENFKLKHDRPGLVSMAHKRGEEGKNCSQFFFTSKAEPKLDGKHVVFGRVIEGIDKLSKLESMGTKGGTPLFEAVISDCGELESEALRTRKRKLEELPLPPGWTKKESRETLPSIVCSCLGSGLWGPCFAQEFEAVGTARMSSLKQPLLPRHKDEVKETASRGLETAFAFAVFIAVRSFHPIIIDISKTDGKLPYGKATPCVVNSAVDIAIGTPEPHVVLEFEVQHLRDELRSYDQELPCWTAEVKAAESFAESLENELKQEELSEKRISEELAEKRKIRPLSPASSQGDRDHSEAVDHLAKGGVHVHHFEDPLIPWNGLTDDEIHNRHQESKMSHEISRREVSIAHLRRQQMYCADQQIAAARKEAEELREALMQAEQEGQKLIKVDLALKMAERCLKDADDLAWNDLFRSQICTFVVEILCGSEHAWTVSRKLTEERQAAEEQELPLREWVKNIEDQVNAARLENARLSSSLSSALAFRASLLPDDAAQTPAGAESGAHIQQEEIAAEERRRESFLRDAAQRTPLPRRWSPAASPDRRSYGMPSTLRSLPPVPTEIHHSNGMGDESDDDKLEYWKSNSLAFLFGGLPGLKQCWDPVPLKVFSAIAVVYAFGDFLEMQSMAVMGGAAYQILLQSKLLVTALIMWAMRGQRQTMLQWNVLVTIALGMSAFVLVDDSSDQAGYSGGVERSESLVKCIS